MNNVIPMQGGWLLQDVNNRTAGSKADVDAANLTSPSGC